MRPLRLVPAVVLALLFGVLGGSARADTTRTITFDDHIGSTTNQYNGDPDTRKNVNFYSAVYNAADSGAHSAPNVAQMPIPNRLGFQARRSFLRQGFDYNDCAFAIEFQTTHTDVSVYVGHSQGSVDRSVTMRAYDVNDNIIATSTATPTVNGPISTPLSVHSPAGAIVAVEVEGQGGYWSADDLSFNVPTDPPPPDFGLANSNSALGGVTLGRGDHADVPLEIRRTNGSTGPITMSASNLPTGVSASFTPSTVTDPSTHSAVTMHLQEQSYGSTVPVQNQGVFVRATPSATAGTISRTVTVPVTVLREFDIRANGLEITQGVQANGPGQGLPQQAITSQIASYRGVGLVSDGFKQTVVRFYADARGGSAGSAPALATLRGYRNGQELPGGPIYPDSGTGLLNDHGNDPTVTYNDRLNEQEPFTFEVPPSWQAGTITLRATVGTAPRFGSAGVAAQECSACGFNNTSELRDITFTKGRSITVDPIQVYWTERPVAGQPRVVPQSWSTPFDLPNQLMPVRLVPHYWSTALDITTHRVFKGFKGWVTRSFIADSGISRNDKASEVVDDIRDLADDHDLAFPVGITGGRFTKYDGTTDDLGSTQPGPYPDDDLALVVNDQRRFASVTHELGHALNRQHASGGCGGAANGQKANPWPDPNGYINSVGIDFATKGAGGAPYHIVGGGRPNDCTGGNYNAPGCNGNQPLPQPVDYMSYCGQEDNVWISAQGWNQIFGRYNGGPSTARVARAVAARVRSGVRVRGWVNAGGTHIASTEVGSVPNDHGTADSPVTVEATNAAGKSLGKVPASITSGHVDGPTPSPVMSFTATVPTASARAVKVLLGGKTVASRTRSRHAPTARFLTPRPGANVGTGKSVKVTWRAADRDKGDVLTVSLDYSRDGGQTWRQIYAGPNTKAGVRLASGYFAHARRARLRLRVNDSFNVTTVRSGVFRAHGAKPLVRIILPVKGTSKVQNATLVFSGYAFDDAGGALRGKRTSWYYGTKFLGHGERISAAGLAAGSHRVRLVAKDALGRAGSASVTVRLSAVPAAFTRVTAPAKLSRKAKSVTLVLGTSVDAALRIGTQRFSVYRQPRKIKVKVTPGASPLTLTLVIASGQFTASRTVVIPRS